MHSDGIEFACNIFCFIYSAALLDISSTKIKYKTMSFKIKYNYLIIILTFIHFLT